MLLCGIAIISTSCKKTPTVNPETEHGSMSVGTQTSEIANAQIVSYGQKKAIVFASKAMTDANNEGVAIVFNGDIVPGTYNLDKSKAVTPRVVGLKDFNMGELRFVFNADSLYFGDVYLSVNGELLITENNGTYTVILSQCTYVIHTDNKFVINGHESPIGLAGITSLGGMNSIGQYQGIHSMLFMSADHQRSFIVSFVGNETVDGEYQLGYFITPYLPTLPCVHVALDADFWTMQPQTGYVAKQGTLKIATNSDGTKTVTMENLKLKNVEHDNEFFFPVLDASLSYTGLMYEIGK